MISSSIPLPTGDPLRTALVACAVALLAALLRPIIHWIRAPYADNILALPGAPVKHFFWGSWPRGAETEGDFEIHLNEHIRAYGAVSSLTLMGRRPLILVGDHLAASKILLQTPYRRVPMINKMLKRHVGDGLIGKEAYPAFTQAAVYRMNSIFHEKASELVAHLRDRAESDASPESKQYGRRIDIMKDVHAVALDIMGLAGFDYHFNSLLGKDRTSELAAAVKECMQLLQTGTVYSALRLLFDRPVEQLGRWLKVEEQMELDIAKRVVRDISMDLVERARARGTGGKDLLSLMVQANASDQLDSPQKLTDAELADLVPVFILAGHETLATSLAWAVLALIDPTRGSIMQARLRQELTLSNASDWQQSASILDSLPYLDAFAREVMRFYCPIRILMRQVPYDDVVPLARPIKLRDGSITSHIKVKKGQTVDVPIAWLNRDESLWGPQGNVFLPERWLPDGHKFKDEGSDLCLDPSVSELRGVWSHLVTFGAGVQQCIGQRMAVMEFKVVLARLITNFEFLAPTLPSEPPIHIEATMTLVAHPYIRGEKSSGPTMPVRYRLVD
ncbi:hypothetical protein OC834_002854 [Tilletia horrida]|nr:hypothetical protein OC834_002854 [Tilletia horrida]